MSNPFLVRPADYTGAFNNLSQGLSSFQQQRQAKDAQARQAAMTAEIQDAVSRNDLNAIADVSIKYPEMAQNIKNAVGFKSEATEKNFKDTAFKILSDPDNTERYLMERAEIVKQNGGDPTQTLKEIEFYKADPKKFLQTTEGVAASMYGKDYKNWYDAMNAGKPEPMTEYQRASLGLQRDKLNFDKEMKRLDYEARKAERQFKAAQGTAKEAEARLKLDQAKAKADEAKIQDKEALSAKIYTAKDNLETAKNLLGNQDFIDDLTGKSGVLQGMGIRPSQDARDAQILFNNIVSSETLNNLGVMSGPLTDKDIEVIRSASTKLKEGMSEGAMKAELTKMVDAYNRVLKNYDKEANRKGYSFDDSASDSVIFTSDKYGDVTEADIQETMSKHGLSRAEVMERLKG